MAKGGEWSEYWCLVEVEIVSNRCQGEIESKDGREGRRLRGGQGFKYFSLFTPSMQGPCRHGMLTYFIDLTTFVKKSPGQSVTQLF